MFSHSWFLPGVKSLGVFYFLNRLKKHSFALFIRQTNGLTPYVSTLRGFLLNTLSYFTQCSQAVNKLYR